LDAPAFSSARMRDVRILRETDEKDDSLRVSIRS
jgi:hypothetical protein